MISIVLIMIASLLACSLPFNLGGVNPTTVAQTFAAGLTETALADPKLSLTATAQAQASATFTETATLTTTPPLAATQTPTVTITPSLSPTATNTIVSAPCNRAAFVADVTYPDYTEVQNNTSFVKTWRLQNNGSCTWTSGYRLVFSHGDRMDAPDEVTLTSVSVAPGGTVDVSVNLKSPSTAGTYQGNFKLKSPDGQIFGIGADASGSFYVLIQVVVPAPGLTLIPIPNLPLLPLKVTKYATSYAGIHTCFMTNIFHFFTIQNTGATDLESWRMNLTDDTLGSGHGVYSDDSFSSSSVCLSPVISKIDSGGSAVIGVKEFSDITGHNMTATFKVCTADGLGGVCVNKSVSFVAE